MGSVRDRDGNRVYCEASFSRGSGLGNRLFPWARCKIFSMLHGVPMLAPMWFTPRVGPLVRGGISLRVYHRQILLSGLFLRSKDYVRGYSRLLAKCRSTRSPEPDDLSVCPVNSDDGWTLVSFRGDRAHFLDLLKWRAEIREALRAETRPRWQSLAEQFSTPLAINVRCGNDFRVAKTVSDFHEKGGIKTPMSWFVESLNAVREVAGWSVPAVVVSDGTHRQLGELLDLPGVRFARPGCAVSDLLTLANARFLIGSGGSSFSAWGAFLSGAPTISHPGQSLEWFGIGQGERQFVREFDPHRPLSADLVSLVRKVLGVAFPERTTNAQLAP